MARKAGGGKPLKFTQEQVIEALNQNGGMIYMTARALKCNPQTLYNYRDKFPDVRAAIETARGEMLDMGELALKRAVLAGEGWAVCFLLKTVGKGRGYIERQELSGPEAGPIRIEIVEVNANSEG